ncbi:MAG: serine--tRNA ligase [Planctomycetes bacterium]|nr:serine--tRNA ligase [Planctomycetota bacterium]MCC7171811.1 serine--tRNA ligase [Planctomycetota bacterium]
MLDLRYIREHADEVREGARKKRIPIELDKLLALDEESRKLTFRADEIRAEINRRSKEIGKLPPEERSKSGADVNRLKDELKGAEERLRVLVDEIKPLHLSIPNVPSKLVPEGKDDTENVEVRREGVVPQFAFKPKDHVELGESLGILDIERGVKVAGTRNYFLKGDGALLERAVLNLAIDTMMARGFTLLSVPVLVRYPAMEGTAYFPGGEEQAYHCEKDDLFLAGTAEVPVTSFHSDEVLSETELPKKYVAWSYCFRREAGAAGKDTRGIYRIHQFQKVEQVIIAPADPDVSERFHQEIVGNAEAVLRALELPYRIVEVCGGDLGLSQIRKYDIETWMPSRERYSETHSASMFYDYQARRLKLRYKDAKAGMKFCYTLNNTVIASPRILIPLLECHQQADGSVRIPQALRSYLGGRDVLKPA